jgi:2-polyprenyl-3-methyl-5-hydroxy-6-metoxy-1,4-benzoquinol methylase
LAAALVGEHGRVIGLDMTDEQLEVARAHAERFAVETLGYAANNMEFLKGYIEGIAAAGVVGPPFLPKWVSA